MAKENDVDLYAELEKELKGAKESEEVETVVASDKDTTVDDKTKKDVVEDENAELTEEEISKLSPRAQKRIRGLAEEVKELAKTKEIVEEKKDDKEIPTVIEPKNVEEFLNAVEDEDSRNLLGKFYKMIKGEIDTTLSPIEQKNNETKFETEFSKYSEKIEGLADYKADLKKTFLRNPTKSVEDLVSKVALDLQLNKVKPLEEKPSDPNRDGKVDTEGMSLDELYDTMDTLKG